MKNWKENYDLVTTFALGEATPEQSAMLEEQMKNDPELRAEVEEIRKMGDFLSETLSHEPLPENIEYPKEEKPMAFGNAPKKRSSWMVRTVVCACALILVVSASILFKPLSMQQSGMQMATTPDSDLESIQTENEQAAPGQNPQSLTNSGGPESLGTETPAGNEEISAAAAPQPEETAEKAGNDQGDGSKSFGTRQNSTNEMMKAKNGLPQLDEIAKEDSFIELSPEPETTSTPESEEDGAIIINFSGHGFIPEDHAKEGPVVHRKAAGNGMPKSFEAPAASRVPAPIPEPIPAPIPSPLPERKPVYTPDGNSFSMLEEQKFQKPEEEPFSTFGIDVDTASYTLMRQYMTEWGRKPPKESVRVEEYINYFSYDLQGPAEDSDCPFETTVEIQKHPWRDGLYMAMVAIKAREIPADKRPKLNLVFLIDVSGSMSDWNKLPLVKDGMMRLLDQLQPGDSVSIVTYANGTEVKLEPTTGSEKGKIEKAILELRAYGGTNGGEGIQKAYELARKNFDKEAVNRVILCTDGDFNVGMTNISELETLIESEAKSGVFLTVLGFGMGNFQDDRMKALASHGNGVYGYVDSRSEAKKMLCDELGGSMITIAKDVKLQIDFNPAKVAAYRLIGYETRHLEAKDFHNDRKDSGDLGAGHTVVALYELVPVGGEIPQSEQVDESRYVPKPEEAAPEKKEEAKPVNDSPEWFFVKLRWKKPDANESTLKTFPVEFKEQPVSQNFQWASGTALFAMLLRESAYTGTANFDTVLELIHPAVGESEQRKEFEELVKKAK